MCVCMLSCLWGTISFCLFSSVCSYAKCALDLNKRKMYGSLYIKFYYDCVCVTFEFMSRFGFIL